MTRKQKITDWLNNCIDAYKIPIYLLEELQAAAGTGASNKKLLLMIQADIEALNEFKTDIIDLMTGE